MVMQSSADYAAGNDGQRLLLVSHDQQALFVPAFVIAEEQQLNGQQLERLIRETVDVHVNAKVDIISLCFFARYSTGMPHSRTAQTWKPTPDLFPRPANDHLYHALEKLGDRDRMQIVVDQCRRRGIQCIASLRMNDRHRITEYVKELYRRHPEWRLESPTGAFSERQGALNFKYRGVREHLLAFTAELLERYDVDGIELDYMRMCHMFEPNEARQHAHLLTEMMRSLREQLSLAARRRKRGSLLLGVRVPSSLAECDILGCDVKAWIRAGLVDFVTPADFWSTDFVARTEEFVDLTALPPVRGKAMRSWKTCGSVCRYCPATQSGALVPIQTCIHKQVVHDPSVYVGDAEIATVVPVSETLVVESEEVQDCGVEIVVRNRRVDGMHSQLVGRTISETAFDAATGHPHGEPVVMMPTPNLRFTIGFFKRGPSELRGPDDQGFVQQAS